MALRSIIFHSFQPFSFTILNSVINKSIRYISQTFSKGQGRTVKAKKNILGSIFIKGASIAISLVMLPITLSYVNSSEYGIWLALSSIVGWFSFFNIGLTNGLRNKFAECKARGDDSGAQTYVSTTYATLAIIFTSVWIIFLLVNPLLDWAGILNVSPDMREELSVLAIIVFTYFCLQFVLRIITTLVVADQQPAKSSLIDLLGQIVSLLFIVILVKTTEGSLINLGWALCLSPIIILLGANILLFKGKYHPYRPLISKIDFSQSRSLFNLGLTFFIIQIASLIQYQSANIIIAQSFGTDEVTAYNVVYRYFNVIGMGFGIFLAPLWSAATDAFYKNDITWIKKAVKKYLQLGLLLACGGGIMLLISEKVYEVWLRGEVEIDFPLSLWGYIFVCCFSFGSIFVNFLNGISALRIQFCASLVTPIIYIAAALLLINYFEIGVHSLFIASIIANINGIIIAPVQYYMIIYKQKKGLWLR